MDNLKTKTLLYAEDEIEIQKLFKSLFEKYFNKVITAKDGEEALKVYKDYEPDVLILDINMPIIDGITLANMLREDKCDKEIILLTARSDKEAYKKAISLGLVDYLEKPIDRLELNNCLEKLNDKFSDSMRVYLWKKDDIFYIWEKNKKELTFKNDTIPLTKKETVLLELFIDKFKHNLHLNYDEIFQTVWYDKDKEYSETTIKTLLNRLRSKLPKNAINNVYGLGYTINLK